MTQQLLKNERGMILLVVLLIVALLVTILVEFAFSTLVDLRLAETYRDSTRANYLAKGGIRVGRIILQEDNNGYDSLDETWGQGIEGYPIAGGNVSIRIEDHGGRLDLNRVVNAGSPDQKFKPRTIKLLRLLGADDPEAITDALIDWIDPDDDSEPTGAENYYYNSLPDPYNCKNGPLDNLEELNLVKGFNQELIRKLRPHVTVHGSDKINVNTASVEVLEAIAEDMDRATAETIVTARKSQAFATPAQLNELLGVETFSIISLYVDVKSSYYQIESIAYVNDGRRTIIANYDDKNNTILYKRVL